VAPPEAVAPPEPPLDEVSVQPQEQMPKIATGKSSIKKLLVLIEGYLRAYSIDRLYLLSFDNLEWLKNGEEGRITTLCGGGFHHLV
jgi:hypothetical protein